MEKKTTDQEESRQPRISDRVPFIPYKILAADLPFFTDSECRNEVPEVRLCILLPLDPDDALVVRDIVPTPFKYQAGDYVDWSLDSKTLWEECWYRDPNTSEIKKAWNFHVNFTGAVISPEALEENRARIQDLEARTLARLDAQGSVH